MSGSLIGFAARGRAWIGMLGCLGTLGCAGNRPVQGATASYGYMVIGPRPAAELRLIPGDTLLERRVEQVPAQVRAAAAQQASAAGFEAACTRYFVSGPTYVALLSVSCAVQEVRDDGEGLAAYDAAGQRIGYAVMVLDANAYTALWPERRDRP